LGLWLILPVIINISTFIKIKSAIMLVV